MRNVLLFCAAVLLALTAGRAFWVSLGENPRVAAGDGEFGNHVGDSGRTRGARPSGGR